MDIFASLFFFLVISRITTKINWIFLTHKIHICRIKSYKYLESKKKKKKMYIFSLDGSPKLPSKNAILFFISLFNKVFAATYCVPVLF